MQYYYYQQVGGNEAWKPIPETKLDTLDGVMFRTILSVDSPIPETADKATFDEIKYKGPFYVDLDDATSPGSTAVNALELVGKLEEQGVFPKQLEIFASGGKGFHILVPEECFLTKPPKTGLAFLPAIFKEMAYELAVESMDFRVYTARRGRMLRCHNVQRPNGLYKVQISYEELVSLVEVYRMSPDAAEAKYKEICSTPRRSLDVETDAPELATGLLALFDQCRTKVGKSKKGKKARPVTLPKDLPSFEALLKGEGIKEDIGFHQLAMQVAIVAHARGMTQVELLDAAAGLCENHESDGNRYNTAGKRRAELARMWEYTEDNPCYVYSPAAITTLLTHPAADFHGLVLTDEEVQAGIVEGEGEQPVDEYGHANVIMTRQGSYALTESGPKLLTALSFDNVVELVSPETNQIAALSADMYIAGRKVGTKEFELEDFNSVSGLNKVVMRQGQAFSGNDIQARGVYMRVIEKARKAKKRMYAVNREGLDFIQIPFHEDEEVQKGFIAWVDGEGIAMEPRVEDKDLKLKFVGFPSSLGSFQTDLSAAPNLKTWLDEESNKEELQVMLRNLLYCQSPAYVGKMLGWTVACFYRMLFHKQYKQFPMLHINGSAGAGKCFAKGTPVLMANGTVKAVEDVVVGDKVLGPDGKVRNVLSLGQGRETMYKITPVKGDPYTVNESHILSLKISDKNPLRLANGRVVRPSEDIANINVKVIYDTPTKIASKLKGWRASAVEFNTEKADLPVDPYWLGLWLGDGQSNGTTIYKPEGTQMVEWLKSHAASLGMLCNKYQPTKPGACPGWSLVMGAQGSKVENPLRTYILTHQKDRKRIPMEYKTAGLRDRLSLIAGLIDSDGHLTNGGYDWVNKDRELAEDFAFLCRSVGLAAYVKPTVKTIKSIGFTGTYWRVSVSGDCDKIPCLDKKAPPRRQVKRHLVHGITVEKLDVGDYYGFEVDGDHLFLLGDFTVVHNTSMYRLFANFHYYKTEVKMLTPSSTVFAVAQAASGSASIPLILDEFKPSEMLPQVYDKFKLMLRDAYNCRTVEKGGGTRENSDYRSVHRTQLSAPICFIAEAAESESALMERVVLLTLVKPTAIQAQQYLQKFLYASQHSDMLGVIGKYMTAQIVKRYSPEAFQSEFGAIYDATRKELMLQADDVNLSAEEYTRKASAKERTVFNYSVAKFGLVKFKNLVHNIYGEEFDEVLNQMLDTMHSTISDIQEQTTPEWLKVMNNFADMARIDNMAPYHLAEGSDYGYMTYNGKTCIELYVRSCYFKYRAYQKAAGSKPLFPSENAFAHALGNLPAVVVKSYAGELEAPGGSLLLDLQELRSAGFLAPPSKG